jgi:hypothetical protein
MRNGQVENELRRKNLKGYRVEFRLTFRHTNL